MIRWGLCCAFREASIEFRKTTVAAISKLNRQDALIKLSHLCQRNADALLLALQYCASNRIGCFRVNSQILPVKTHPSAGYEIDELPESDEILRKFRLAGTFAKKHKLRTSFHPDQFVVLNSKRSDVVTSSLREIEYQAEVAEWIGADVINIHAGGAFGDKRKALAEFEGNLERLSPNARKRLTVENDDKIFTPSDLLPICKAAGVPLVLDVHHHRCNEDELSIEEATKLAMKTWNREPLFHISSPRDGWDGPKPERHHEMILPGDFPKCWLNLSLTVEVEAKAKELAVFRLKKEIDTMIR